MTGDGSVGRDVGSSLRFRLLGPVQCLRDGVELDLATTRQKAVLAVLALTPGKSVPVPRIVAAVWADDPPANGPNVVQKYVAGLRRALEPDRLPRSPGQVIVLGDAGYRLAVDPETVDVVGFERRVVTAAMAARRGQTEQALADAASALEDWRGEPLAGLAGPWFAAARQRLTDGRANAVETWASCRLDLGHPEAALDVLSRQVVTHPRRERSWELLMLALHGSGRTADALDTYRQARDRLVEQTGLEPSPALRALHERLLRDDAGWAAAGPPVPPPVALPPVPFPSAPPQPVPWQNAPPQPVSWQPELLPKPSPGGAPSRPPRATRLAVLGAKLLGTALPLVSFGMLTWAVIGMFALLRRSLPLAASAAGYFALTVVTFVLLGGDRPDTDPMTDVGAALALLAAFGGSLQAAALAFGLFGRARAQG